MFWNKNPDHGPNQSRPTVRPSMFQILQVEFATKRIDNESKCILLHFCVQIYGFSNVTGVILIAVSHVTLCHFCDNHICLSFMIIPVNKKAYRVNYSPIVSMTKQIQKATSCFSLEFQPIRKPYFGQIFYGRTFTPLCHFHRDTKKWQNIN